MSCITPPSVQPTDPIDPAMVAETMASVQASLLKGQREKALAAALDAKQYPLALLIASICGRQKYQEVVRQYMASISHVGSVLHTVGMVFSGQGDVVAKNPNEMLVTDWMPNLAAVITNRTNGWDGVVRELGDRLLSQGKIVEGHFCHMVAGGNIESPSPQARLVLLGVDHRNAATLQLKNSEGISSFQLTEAFEWAKRRGNKSACIPSLQAFKLSYARVAADEGEVEVRERRGAKRQAEKARVLCINVHRRYCLV